MEVLSHNATLTLSLAAGAGVILVIVGQRLRVPSIVLLLLGGVLLGPEVLGWIDPAALGEGLEIVIALAVAVILFEGGLTLELDGYRRAPTVIRRLLTIGPLVTWLGTAGVVYLLFGLSLPMSLMAGSLVIVTGPTVVSPLLRRIRVRERLHHVLYWEGVLIDVIGVFVAVLCYEWLTPDESLSMLQPLARFGLRILVGVGIGLVIGFAVAVVLERRWVPEDHVNIFVLAAALVTFGIAHRFLTEAGILAVVVAGLVVGLREPPQLKRVKRFKLQLTELGIGALFILLSAKLELAQFTGWRLLVLLLAVIFVIRPIVIWLATWGQEFEPREKLFLSWIAPRGIVAAAMASLFAVRLQELGHPEAAYLETFTFAVIATTVTFQGLSAPWVASLLGVERAERRTWVLLGDRTLVAPLGAGLKRAGATVVEVTGPTPVDEELDADDPRFADVHASLSANTSSAQNAWTAMVCRIRLGVAHQTCFRWSTPDGDSELPIDGGKPVGRTAWPNLAAGTVAEGIRAGTHDIEVIEIGDGHDEGRFGQALQPLFWVKDGHAKLIENPLQPGRPGGDYAVVLRRRVSGLADLLAHVELVSSADSAYEATLGRLATVAAGTYPTLPVEDLVQGIIDRGETMPAAVGGGIAIPHGYCAGLDRGRCFLAVVSDGVPDLNTPDDQPVRLVFLLLSPPDAAQDHLRSLAALAMLGQNAEFVDLLSRQTVPARVARLIQERG